MLSALDHLEEIAATLRRRNSALMTDIDGTISAVVDDPNDAVVTEGIKTSLKALTERLALVAILTGRPAKEGKRMVGIRDALYFGNHGMERLYRGRVVTEAGGKRVASIIARLIPNLQPKLEPSGVRIEDKGVGISMHYRTAQDPRAAHAVILAVLKQVGIPTELEMAGGKMVVELRPRGGSNKGFIVKRLAREYRLDGIVYLGDDLTDVEAFDSVEKLGGSRPTASIAVLTDETPEPVRRAGYYVEGVEGTAKLLAALVPVLVSATPAP